MAITLDGTVGATFPAGGVGNTAGAGVGTTDTQTLTNKLLSLAAGTTSVAPLQFNNTSSAILTTQTKGAWEYDGNAMYTTPGTGRGVLPAISVYCQLGTSNQIQNNTTAQNIFGGNGANTSWNPSTTSINYLFEINIGLSRSSGTTSHTISFGFAGTSTVSNVFYRGTSLATGTGTYGYTANAGQFAANSTASTVCSGTITTAATFGMTINGFLRFSATGTLIPQFTLSAAPGAAYVVAPGSYMTVYPIGNQGGLGTSASATRVGIWN
jgi:hypothetical protein